MSADHKQETFIAAAAKLWALTNAAAPGSDQQLQFLKAFVAYAQSPAHLDVVAALFDGTTILDSLEINQDLRWELLGSLATGGRAGTSEIDAELARDSTQNGMLAAAEAKAAIPTAEAKAEAWESVVIRGDLANAAARAAITGFNRAWDTTLLEPYVETYFASIKTVWAEKGYETSSKIIVGLFPAHVVAQSTVDAADAFLAGLGDESPALRRLIVENRDGVVRALKARAADA